MISKAQILV